MQNSSKRSLLIASVAFVCVGLLCVNLYAQAPDGRVSSKSSNSFNRLDWFPGFIGGTGPIPNSASILIRNENGIAYTISTTMLQPSSPYTNWYAIFNHPEFCSDPGCGGKDLPPPFGTGDPRVEGSLVWATGRVVDANGQGNFSGHLGVGKAAAPGVVPAGDGLLNPLGAEIHIAVRAHGPALTGAALQAQLTMLNGGCPPNPAANCQNVQVAMQHFPKGGGAQE